MVTRNQLAAAVQVFCDHPDQWALLRERPELAMKAFEEAMRKTAREVKFWQEQAGHVEHMALVRERIGAVAPPVCRIRKEI